jgi:hypothetical protein
MPTIERRLCALEAAETDDCQRPCLKCVLAAMPERFTGTNQVTRPPRDPRDVCDGKPERRLTAIIVRVQAGVTREAAIYREAMPAPEP